MKYRCQCGKPEYATWITKDGRQQKSAHFTLPPFEGNTLHFKAATMFCERCGTPICKKCSYFASEWDYYNDMHYLCHTCAELESER